MKLPITGPSYDLRVRKADVQRSVNLFPSMVESTPGQAILQSIPGLAFGVGLGAYIRGMTYLRNSLFAVAGDRLFQVLEDGTTYDRGYVEDDGRMVGITYNRNQLIITTRGRVYAVSFFALVSVEITAGTHGSDSVAVLDGRAVLAAPGTDYFYWSAIDDVTSFDPLDFATAESVADVLVAVIADHGDLMLFGTESTEIWNTSPGSETPFVRNNGARIDVGAVSANCIKSLDNTVFWVGVDRQGHGVVWKMQGFTPMRVSTQAVEEKLQSLTDLSGAVAYTYQQDGHSFYCLNVPGLDTTWCFDVSTGAWHERAELVDGEYTQHRATHHVFAFGKHILGSSDGTLYVLDPTLNSNNGDPLVRSRVVPNSPTPTFAWQTFASFQLDTITGKGKPDGSAPLLMMRYSDDGGESWKNWRTVSLGVTGERSARAIFRRLGRSRDRVWEVRCTDDTPFAITGAEVL
jgi:hypothetical protein